MARLEHEICEDLSAPFVIRLAFPDAVATAHAVLDAIIASLTGLPAALRRTLPWDQGKELALHRQITAQTGADVFFCDAHSPWQRGSNENMNGLVRDYCAKGTAQPPCRRGPQPDRRRDQRPAS